jgi:3-dehydroquinate synthase
LREIRLNLPGQEQSYRVLIDPGLRQDLGRLLEPLDFPRRLFLVSDGRVARLYGATVEKTLKDAAYSPTLLSVPPGEGAKTWTVVLRLARELLRQGAQRRTPLIALGGGVVGDLTGFLASIFMRGLPFLQVPTTLLAMVDAAIGGKTAINLPEGKNLLGTFHQPRLVIIDPEFLNTLPKRARLNGLAEVLKAAFIQDADLLDRLAALRPRLFQDQEELTEIIHRAAAIKARVVMADEREAGLRRILNFGHTLGHALEAASRFRLPHGRAVAWGMAAGLSLSEKLAGLPAAEAQRGRQVLKDFGFTRTFPPLDPKAILAALTLDKKRREDRLVFVLLKRLGEAVIHPGIPLPLVAEVLAGTAGGVG